MPGGVGGAAGVTRSPYPDCGEAPLSALRLFQQEQEATSHGCGDARLKQCPGPNAGDAEHTCNACNGGNHADQDANDSREPSGESNVLLHPGFPLRLFAVLEDA